MGNDSVFGLIDAFNKMWSDFPNFLDGNWYNPSDWYNVPSFPPVDVSIDKDKKDIVFDFAVAGYTDENMDINFSGDYLILKMTSPVSDESAVLKPIHKGIRKPDVNFRYYVPSDKYDQDNVEANLSNGILTVRVHAREEAQKKKINITK